MEAYILYLFYLAIILVLGVIIAAASSSAGISSILFLVLAGHLLKYFGLDYFDGNVLLAFSSIALILIILETTLNLDMKKIVSDFLQVLKFSAGFFVICVPIMAIAIFYFFDIPGKGFDVVVFCILLGILICGSDSSIAMEFLPKKKNRVKEMLEIEGITTGPIVVIFSFYLISYLIKPVSSFSGSMIMQVFELGKEASLALLLGFLIAWGLYELLKNFRLGSELIYLLIFATAIITFAAGNFINIDGGLAVAIFGIMLGGFARSRTSTYDFTKRMPRIFAHLFYIIIFMLLGMKSSFPAAGMWAKGALLFALYLLVRLACVFVFLAKLRIREKLLFALNVAKGIEAAVILFIMQLSLGHIEGIAMIVSLGFMFVIYSYIVSTIVNKALTNL